MIKYLKIYLHILKLSFIQAFTFRVSFAAGLLAAFSHAFVRVMMILFISNLANGIAGWTQGELLLFTGVHQLFVYLMFFLFYRNMRWLARDIFTGNFDYALTKPIDSQFVVFLRPGGLHNLICALTAFFVIGWSSSHYHLGIEAFPLVWLFLFLGCGLLLVYSFLIIGTSLAFWFDRIENIIELVINWSIGVSRFPIQAYHHLAEPVFLFLLPLVLITTVPAQTLLAKFDLKTTLALVTISLGAFLASRKFFQRALRFYTSASS
jgi:ABC-2 type transport system permease protein